MAGVALEELPEQVAQGSASLTSLGSPDGCAPPADTMLRHLRATDAMKNFSEFRQEASMLHALQHPCIVSLIGISIHPLCFALELAPLGSLNTVLSENAKGTSQAENFPKGWLGARPPRYNPWEASEPMAGRSGAREAVSLGGSLLLPGLAGWARAHLPHSAHSQLPVGEESHFTRSTL